MDTTSTVKRRTPRRRKNGQLPILIIEGNADKWLIMRAASSQRFPEVKPVWVSYKAQAITYLETYSQDTNMLPRLILVDLYLPRAEDGFGIWSLQNSIPFLENQPSLYSANRLPKRTSHRCTT